MPRLPKGMKKRREAYYWRYRKAGKEHWVPLGSDLRTAAKRLRELKRQGTVHRSELTVYELAQKWLALCVPMGRNEKNQRTTRVRVEKYLKPQFGGLRASDLKAEHFRRYRLWLEKRSISPATVGHILGDLRSMLRWAEDEGWLERSLFPRRLLPRLQERPPDRLTDLEVARVSLVEEPYRYIVRLALETGLRWGELTRVRAEDYQAGCLVVHHTKTGRVRRVPCSPEFVRGRVGYLVGRRDPGVFARAIRRRTGIERFHVHQLRHTFACKWLEDGGSLASLQELLGHTTIVTTQRYGRVSAEHVKREWGNIRGNTQSPESRKLLSAED